MYIIKNRLTFTNSPRPLLTGSIRVKNASQAIADIKNSESDGARSFILHIQMMDIAAQNHNEFKRIFSSTKYPVMAINYPTRGYMHEPHVELLYEAIKAGAACADFRGDLFDPNPRESWINTSLPFVSANPNEITMNPEVISKQKEHIAKAQEMGAEVLMSAHVGTYLNCEQSLSVALEIESRGVDIVKIVTSCPTVENMIDMLHTTVELKKQLKVPFLYICSGPHAQLFRYLAPLFGSCLVFGHHQHNEMSNTLKQLLPNLNEFYRIVPWRIEDYLD